MLAFSKPKEIMQKARVDISNKLMDIGVYIENKLGEKDSLQSTNDTLLIEAVNPLPFSASLKEPSHLTIIGSKTTIHIDVGNETHVSPLNEWLLGSPKALRIDNALNAVEAYLGKSYGQDSTEELRTENTDEALENMDCSEFVSRYLKELGLFENVPYFTTGIMVSDNFADTYIDKLQYIEGSGDKNFKDIQKGDIFVYNGHTCVVTEYYTWYCKEGDGKPSIDVIEAVKENFTGCDQEKKYYEKVKTGRKPKYYFEGKIVGGTIVGKQTNIKYYRIK